MTHNFVSCDWCKEMATSHKEFRIGDKMYDLCSSCLAIFIERTSKCGRDIIQATVSPIFATPGVGQLSVYPFQVPLTPVGGSLGTYFTTSGNIASVSNASGFLLPTQLSINSNTSEDV